jgi:hypothetical protein
MLQFLALRMIASIIQIESPPSYTEQYDDYLEDRMGRYGY